MKLRRFLSCMMALLLVCGLPLAAFADTYDIAKGSIQISASAEGFQTVTQNGKTADDNAPVITGTTEKNTVTITAEKDAKAEVTLKDVNIVKTGSSGGSDQGAVTIDVADGAKANVTLSGVNIDVSGTGGYISSNIPGEAAVQITGNGDVTIELDGENTVQSGHWRAGVEKNTTAATETEPANGTGKLTITDENETHGSLEATGGKSGSGIGGGYDGSSSNITISGSAEVTAQGNAGGAGIGGGSGDGSSSGSNITIQGNARVTAKGGNNGSGIGGGKNGDGSNITIEGSAEVTATGGSEASGIGGGDLGSGNGITITGSAEVTANGGSGAAGIGGGGSGGNGSDITIEGSAEVTAKGGMMGAGIGGGDLGSGNGITIEGSAEVTAQGGQGGAGIGGGYNSTGKGTGSDITVSGDAQVKAQGGESVVDSNASTPFAHGAGAAIGNGGASGMNTTDAEPLKGQEVAPNTRDLNKGWIATYTPGTTDLDNTDPDTLTYKGADGVTTSTNVTFVPAADPTCEDDGNTAGFQCGNDQVGIVTIQATGHNVPNGTPNGDATCVALGTMTGTCTNCKTTVTVTDPNSKLKEHTFTTYTPDPDNLATCTEDGTKTAVCDVCKNATDTVPDPAKGHSFTDYVSDGNATYTEDGTKTAHCDHSGCTETHTIPDPGSRLVPPRTALYQVVGQDDKTLTCQETRKDGVLTITVEGPLASLVGKLSGMQALKAQGIDTIVFVTSGATSTFAVEDLLAQGAFGDSYQLTHDGSTVTFTLNGTDIGKILK